MKQLFFAAYWMFVQVNGGWGQATIVSIVATGNSTGHIADITVRNDGTQTAELSIPAATIPSQGGTQGFVIAEPILITVPPHAVITVPMPAYCMDADLPAPKPGYSFPQVTAWSKTHPILLMVRQATQVARQWQQNRPIMTPLGSNPEKERETIIQQIIWTYTAPADKPYTASDFCRQMHQQIRAGDNNMKPEIQEIQSGLSRIWDAVAQIGAAAGVDRFLSPGTPLPPVGLTSPAPSLLPEITSTIKATGTGRTTGHIADLTIRNPTSQPVQVQFGPAADHALFIPSQGQYQPYVVPYLPNVSLEPGETKSIPVQGYCVDVRMPPVPAGSAMPSFESWITAAPEPGSTASGIGALVAPVHTALSLADAVQILKNTPLADTDCLMAPLTARPVLPGTNLPISVPINVETHPGIAIPLLLDAIQQIGPAYDRLKSQGKIVTPFSGNPEKEREAVIQQSFWVHSAALRGAPYEKNSFRDNTIRQYENNTGKQFEQTPRPQQEKMEQGVDDFWNTFEAVGVEAKVLQRPPQPPVPTPSTDAFFISVFDQMRKPNGTSQPANSPQTVASPEAQPVVPIDKKKDGPGKDACECGDVSFKIELWHMQPNPAGELKGVNNSTVEVKEKASNGKEATTLKGGMQGIKKGDKIQAKITGISMSCPCSNGSACHPFTGKTEADAYKTASEELEKMRKDTADAKGKLETAEKNLKTAKDAGKDKSTLKRLEKKVNDANTALKNLTDKVTAAEKKVSESVSGRFAINNAKGDELAVGSWEKAEFKFGGDELKRGDKKIEFGFKIEFYCEGNGCKEITCNKSFVVKVEE